MVPNLGSIRIKSIWENPLGLLFSSVIIFSLIVIFLLALRPMLFYTNSSGYRKLTPAHSTSSLAPVQSVGIPRLQERVYTPTVITSEENVAGGENFTSNIISFVVDGFREYALLNIPTSPRPSLGYPVIILNHGYIQPSQYDTVSSYATIANFFANNGYIVLKPDYRGNGNSQGSEDALQRYNYPVDVLTLLASVKHIPNADMSHMYLWGHSMGGEVTLTVLEVLGKQSSLAKGVRAAVLWAPVTDPAQWFGTDNLQKIPEAILTPFPYTKTFQILGTPSDSSAIWQSINPLRFLSAIVTPVQLNHGTGDQTVPYAWSQELAIDMQHAQKFVTFISYPGADHNLSPDTTQALQNNLDFFNSHK